MSSREKCCKMMKPQIFTLSEVFLCLFSGCGVIHPSFRTYGACRQDWSLHLLLPKKRRGPVALRRKQSSRYLLKCSLGQTGVTGLPFCFCFLKKEAVKKKIRKKNTISPTQSFLFTCEKEMDKIQREKNRKVEEGV